MTTFTSEDRANASLHYEEPIPFAGWVTYMDEVVMVLRDQIKAQQSEINRLNEHIRHLESKLHGGS